MTKIVTLSLALLFIRCTGHDDRVIERWDNNTIKAKKVFYNDRDTAQYLLVTYHENGNQSGKSHFIDSIKNGWSVTFYENEKVQDSIFYRNDIPATTIRHYHHNGSPAYVGQFDENGKNDGPWTYFDSLGRLSEVTEFAGDDIKIKTTYFDTLGWMVKEVLFEEGTIGEIQEEKNFKDSLLNGQYHKYHPTGIIAQNGEFIAGKRKNTEWTDFYSTGQKLREYVFTGEYDWNVKILNVWNEEGMQTVKDGKGKYTTYSYCPNGKIKTKTVSNFKDGFATETKEYKISACR